MSVKKNLFKNGIASILQKIVRVLEQLFLVPFFISAWGAAYYGEWLTLTIIPSVIAFSDLGFGVSAGNRFVLAYAGGHKQEAANVSKTGFTLIGGVVVLGMLISIVSLLVFSFYDVFKSSLINNHDALWSVSILILARLTRFFVQLFEAYYRSARKAAFGMNLVSIRSFLNLAVGLLVLVLGYGVIQFAISQLIVESIFTIIFGFIGARYLDYGENVRGRFDKAIVKEISSKGFGYLLSPMWQSLLFQGSTFVVRLVLGPTAVTIYNTLRTLVRSGSQLFNMVSGTVFPELQFEIGANHMEKARKLFRFSVFLLLMMGFFGVMFLLLFGKWFYNIWTDNQLDVPNGMWYLFVISILFNSFWWVAGDVFRAMNKPYLFNGVGLLSATLSILVTYVACNIWGLDGAALGALVFEMIMVIIILPRGCKLLGVSLGELFDFKENILLIKDLAKKMVKL